MSKLCNLHHVTNDTAVTLLYFWVAFISCSMPYKKWALYFGNFILNFTAFYYMSDILNLYGITILSSSFLIWSLKYPEQLKHNPGIEDIENVIWRYRISKVGIDRVVWYSTFLFVVESGISNDRLFDNLSYVTVTVFYDMHIFYSSLSKILVIRHFSPGPFYI